MYYPKRFGAHPQPLFLLEGGAVPHDSHTRERPVRVRPISYMWDQPEIPFGKAPQREDDYLLAGGILGSGERAEGFGLSGSP